MTAHKIPAIAFTAVNLEIAAHEARLQTIAEQTVRALGLDPADRWTVRWSQGDVVQQPDAERPA